MKEVAEGNRASFEELRARLEGPIYAISYQVLNDPSDAEEVAQDILTQLWSRADEFQARKGKLSTWVSTITRNRSIDRLRSNRRRYRLRDEFGVESGVREQAQAVRNGYTNCARNDDAGCLREAVKDLSDPQRVAIELVYFKGLTQREAAEILHQPLGTVKARVRRGIAKLRETLPEML
ncbi:MAG: RNA polymerase sigma factor [Verrucomicrobiota bacterium]